MWCADKEGSVYRSVLTVKRVCEACSHSEGIIHWPAHTVKGVCRDCGRWTEDRFIMYALACDVLCMCTSTTMVLISMDMTVSIDVDVSSQLSPAC